MLKRCLQERARGGCPADWVWVVPPISGSATPVFHLVRVKCQNIRIFMFQHDLRYINNYFALSLGNAKLLFEAIL